LKFTIIFALIFFMEGFAGAKAASTRFWWSQTKNYNQKNKSNCTKYNSVQINKVNNKINKINKLY